MYIVFGDLARQIPNSYTLLELDTFKILPDKILVPTWCVVEKIGLEDFPTLEHKIKMHNDLMQQYRQRNWDFCLRAIEVLMGSWNGEVDSFYIEISRRISEFLQQPPPQDWDATLERTQDWLPADAVNNQVVSTSQ